MTFRGFSTEGFVTVRSHSIYDQGVGVATWFDPPGRGHLVSRTVSLLPLSKKIYLGNERRPKIKLYVYGGRTHYLFGTSHCSTRRTTRRLRTDYLSATPVPHPRHPRDPPLFFVPLNSNHCAPVKVGKRKCDLWTSILKETAPV